MPDSPSPLLGLPDTSVTFDRAQFRLGVWGQGAPGGFRAKYQSWAGGRLCGAHVACDPERPNAAVHPLLQRLVHQLGFAARLLHGRLLRRQLQHGAELLHALLQVQVAWRARVEPTVLYCEESHRKEIASPRLNLVLLIKR